jgi:hypothetical protein
MAAFRYHFSRMHSLPLTTEKTDECPLIQLAARNNNIPPNFLQKLNRQIQQKINHVQTEGKGKEKNPWITFIYSSPRIRKSAVLFKHTNIGMTFKNTNTLQQLTILKTIKHHNITSAEFANFHATIAIGHTSDR